MKLIECVPNISEGRDKNKIDRIVRAAQNCGVKILNVDAGLDANRTVITFAGAPEKVFDAAFALVQKSCELIDMRAHNGTHPRLGAADVCPFIPLRETAMRDCVDIALKLAAKVSAELQIPVYLYEEAAATPERKNLAFIRKGGYESLPQKLKELPPDFGPPDFSPAVQKSGALITGARNFLIAFNVTLNTTDVEKAKQIAAVLRSKLKAVKALGWAAPQYNAAQVSFNLTDYKTTPLYDVYETCKSEAAKLGLEVKGSEIIGLVPEAALVRAGKKYLSGDGVCRSKEQKINAAVTALNLNLHAPFRPAEKIIERVLL
ncbi:MAG: glutamate formimidoyltransferase [Elusimicrobium sp.]|jgi:glutamate formiminotransferase|nr:glutamate formimidoyltransferase [Elusimicrobium sp.]